MTIQSERLQKVLARRGIASRRASEELIASGRVKVNGITVTELGVKVDPSKDEITVDGMETEEPGRPVIIALNKPKGYVSTVKDPHAEKTVMMLVDYEGRRLYPVGRLDRESRGLLLLTDDGELAQKLLHPSHEIEKVYEVKAIGEIGVRDIEKLIGGVELDDGKTAPARIEDVRIEKNRVSMKIAIKEGKKRQIRRMIQSVGGRVYDLRRVEFGGITLGMLPEGSWRELSRAEGDRLRARLGLKSSRPRKGKR